MDWFSWPRLNILDTDLNLVFVLLLFYWLFAKMVGYSSLLPLYHMSLVPQIMLEIEAERTEVNSPSTAHLASLGLKEYSDHSEI